MAQIGRILQRVQQLLLVEEDARLILFRSPKACGRVEPDLVLLDRAAEAAARGVDVLLLIAVRRNAAGTQLGGDVPVLQPLARVLGLSESPERVAALADDHVDRDAARLGLRR